MLSRYWLNVLPCDPKVKGNFLDTKPAHLKAATACKSSNRLCGEFEREVLQMTQDLGTGEVPYDTSDIRHDVGDGGHRQQHHSLKHS